MNAERTLGGGHPVGRVPLRRCLRTGLAGFASGLMAGLWAGPAAAQSAAVVMYHRFGESAVPSTNIALAQFEAHLAELASGRYRVLGLPEIVEALRLGRALPDRTVGISVDDAYASLWTEGWPRIKALGLPLTVFVATGSVDRNVSGFMTWDQLRALKAAGVTIGSQTASHPHMPLRTADFNAAEIERSNARFKAELGA
ncbi:MAG: polysaccharide deacetylase family protein [Proteobacteria bacterium]|nr:polysaccharide deacetylase family protein [Pseudomonadota bacterium]